MVSAVFRAWNQINLQAALPSLPGAVDRLRKGLVLVAEPLEDPRRSLVTGFKTQGVFGHRSPPGGFATAQRKEGRQHGVFAWLQNHHFFSDAVVSFPDEFDGGDRANLAGTTRRYWPFAQPQGGCPELRPGR